MKFVYICKGFDDIEEAHYVQGESYQTMKYPGAWSYGLDTCN